MLHIYNTHTCILIHAHMHTYTHAHMHTYTFKRLQTQTRVHTCTHPDIFYIKVSEIPQDHMGTSFQHIERSWQRRNKCVTRMVHSQINLFSIYFYLLYVLCMCYCIIILTLGICAAKEVRSACSASVLHISVLACAVAFWYCQVATHNTALLIKYTAGRWSTGYNLL